MKAPHDGWLIAGTPRWKPYPCRCEFGPGVRLQVPVRRPDRRDRDTGALLRTTQSRIKAAGAYRVPETKEGTPHDGNPNPNVD